MVTIVFPVSRPDFLKRIFAQLELMDCNAQETNVLTYVDGDQQLYEIARNLTVKSKFRQKLCIYRAKGQANVSSVKRRRQRIADIHNEMKALLNPCDYVFSLEDDTLFPTNTLTKFLQFYSETPHAGLISGVQIGRWGYTHIGAWTVDNYYETNYIASTPQLDNVVQIAGVGLYCLLTPYKIYQKHYFKPFQEILGPDFDYGLELCKAGYKNYADFSIKCSHLTKRGEIKFKETPIQQAIFKRIGSDWVQEVV